MGKFYVIITQHSTESYIVHAAQQLLEIELQSGEMTERLVNVKRPGTHLAPHKGSVLTVDELSDFDDIQFLLCEDHDATWSCAKER